MTDITCNSSQRGWRRGAVLALGLVLVACGRGEPEPAEEPQAEQFQAGALCGDPSLVGERIDPIPGKLPGCGVAEPVRITQVRGIPLSTPATVDCNTARTFSAWVAQSAKPALADIGGGLVELRVAASYACRTRNHRPGAKISEHGKGKAIDISAFRLADGSTITLLDGWNGRGSQALRQMHRAACGPFGTVLGPESDSHHRDHFHFDTAVHGNGSYCR